MTRSRLVKNKQVKHKTGKTRLLYTQQRNKCVLLLRKTKINYGNLEERDIKDNKNFQKTAKPLLFDKSVNSDKIHHNENGELNNFFSNSKKFQSMRTLIPILKMLKIQFLRKF